MEPVGTINSDGSWVGRNVDGLTGTPGSCKPGQTTIYRFYARAEGTFLLYTEVREYFLT
jgi:hypothetical protein